MASTSNESGHSTLHELNSISENDPSLSNTAIFDPTIPIPRPPPCIRNQTARSGSAEGSPSTATPTVSRTSSKTSLSRSMRSPSASSFLYHMKKVPMNDAVPLGANADPALVKEFLDIAEERAKAFEANVHRSRAFQVFWYFLISCIIYFGFAGYPLWDGIAYSI